MKKTDLPSNETESERQERFRRKTVRAMIEVAFVFAVPAFIALFTGKRLDSLYDSGKFWLFTSLAVAFVFSWGIIIRMYIRLSREARDMDESVRRKIQSDKKKISQNRPEDDEPTSMIF